LTQLLQALDAVGLESLNTYEMVVLIASLARLRHTPKEAWLSGFFLASEPRLRDCGTGNLTTILRAVSKLNMASWDIKSAKGFASWMSSIEELTKKRMNGFRGDELVRLISAMAVLMHKPSGE
jgi:hypothetical protein